MDNVQNCDSYINIPSSQTYRSYSNLYSSFAMKPEGPVNTYEYWVVWGRVWKHCPISETNRHNKGAEEITFIIKGHFKACVCTWLPAERNTSMDTAWKALSVMQQLQQFIPLRQQTEPIPTFQSIISENSTNEEWCLLGCYAVWLL
jgi:hypothetical protein